MNENSFFYDITIDYLKNNKFLENKIKKINKSVSKKEKKFYKKRIISITNELLKDDYNDYDDKFPEIKLSFNNYIKVLISYFKLIDKNELIQNEFINDEETNIEVSNCEELRKNNCKNFLNDNENDEDKKDDEDEDVKEYKEYYKIENMDTINELIIKDKKNKINTLDNFVIKKSNCVEETIITPKKKSFNLKDPKFKTKGVLKKKNIPIIYETQDEEKSDIKKFKRQNEENEENGQNEQNEQNKQNEQNE